MMWQRVISNQKVPAKIIVLGLLMILWILSGGVVEIIAEDSGGISNGGGMDIPFSTVDEQIQPIVSNFGPQEQLPTPQFTNSDNIMQERLSVVQDVPSTEYSFDSNYRDSISYYSRKNVNLSPGALPGKKTPPRSPGMIPLTDPLLSQQLSESVLNQAPDRETRMLIERARQNELDAQRGGGTNAEK